MYPGNLRLNGTLHSLFNQVAFDAEFADKKIDVYGTISKVTTDFMNNSIIILKVGNYSVHQISCYSTIKNKDAWAEEVKKVVVGDSVHIQGIYSSTLSDEYTMQLYRCHITK